MTERFKKFEGRSFWQSASLKELAEEQGIMSIADIDKIAFNWPVEDDPDALLAFILSERSEKRTIIKDRDA